MNGVSTAGLARGWPATAVVKIGGSQRIAAPADRNGDAEAALVAGVAIPPRVGEVRPIGALLPEILARYGLAKINSQTQSTAFDCLA